MEKKIKEVTHPVPIDTPKGYIMVKRSLGKIKSGKVKKRDKFVIYEFHGAKIYTGWSISSRWLR